MAAYVLGFFCLILAVGMLAGWQRDGALRAKLKESGKKVEGSVVAASTHNIVTGKTSHMEERLLSVIYMDGLKMYSKDFRVTQKGFSEHPQGSKVDVVYDPGDPEQALLAGDFELKSASSAWIGGALFAVLAIALLWYAVRGKRRKAVAQA